jgi:hypothetical protein
MPWTGTARAACTQPSRRTPNVRRRDDIAPAIRARIPKRALFKPPCHSEPGDSRVRNLTSAHAIDAVDGTARAARTQPSRRTPNVPRRDDIAPAIRARIPKAATLQTPMSF